MCSYYLLLQRETGSGGGTGASPWGILLNADVTTCHPTIKCACIVFRMHQEGGGGGGGGL